MPSRLTADLDPRFQDLVHKWWAACEKEGIDILIYCTYRSRAEQAVLFAQGRSMPGHVVTNARPGESSHNWRLGLDFVPMWQGKPDWSDASGLYTQAIKLAENLGMESLRHSRFPELAHLQMPNWKSLIVKGA